MLWTLKSFPLQVVVKDYAVPVEKVTAIRMRRCVKNIHKWFGAITQTNIL